MKACFNSLKPDQIRENISVLRGKELIPGQSLLFLNEISIPLGIKTSQQNFDATLPMVSIPLYAVGQIIPWLRKITG